MRYLFPFLAALTLAVSGAVLVHAQAADKAANPDLPDFVICDLRVQEFPARTYLYTEQQTTLAQIGPTVGQMMGKIVQAIGGGEFNVVGPPIFVYDGATGEMDKPFTLQVGFPVADGTKSDDDELRVRPLERYRCATVLYSGSMANIGQAYQRIFPELAQAGLTPVGGSREMHLYFESPESPNNVVLIQVGVK